MCSQNSIEPLKITERTMRRVLNKYHIGREFIDILFAMGNKPREAEAGIRRIATKKRLDGKFGNSNYIDSNSYTDSYRYNILICVR